MDEQMNVPYIVYESSMSRMERALKRMFVALVVSIIVMLGSNVAWLLFINQYEYVEEGTDVTLTNEDGNANYIGNDGDIYNGIDSGSHIQEGNTP